MEGKSLVSVIVPVHNTAAYLRKCVDSICNQSLKEIEIILVDNLSTDGSAEICDNYLKTDSRVKVLHLQEANASVARNAGIEIASSPYIGFIDSDDYIEPNMYEELLAAIRLYEVDAVYSNFCIEHTDGRTELFEPNSGVAYKRSSRDVVYEMMCDRLNSSCCTKLFNKTLFDSLKFPTHNVYEDRFVLHRWILACGEIVWIDKAFYHYVERNNSICHVISPSRRHHFFLAQFYRLEFIGNCQLFNAEELYQMRNYLVRSCLSTFKEMREFLNDSDAQMFIADMRQHFKKLLVLSKNELDVKCYKRLRKIVHFWPLYYLIHFKMKKKIMSRH
ncbi:glycosyltransferase family 2 protein [Bacteroides bouchesdurhonensis]|uniref:glycosyltransferase family 2 protein n=1 Tax=Bacteroides bouchesdurhonensis TaxID=1841855 RepID=UPI0022E36846|nr:glycosyltransferase family 2 protein [Bacteroides bouchesdurhonensis]